MPIPLALSDAELDAILSLAAPIALHERDLYLLSLGAELAGHPVPGVGLVSRIAGDLQQKFSTPARAHALAYVPRHDANRDRHRARQRAEVEA
jgi:hypothetical protein